MAKLVLQQPTTKRNALNVAKLDTSTRTARVRMIIIMETTIQQAVIQHPVCVANKDAKWPVVGIILSIPPTTPKDINPSFCLMRQIKGLVKLKTNREQP